jgi:hypothetical protein
MFFIVAGATKLIRSKQTLVATSGGAWASDFSPSAIKSIGALEVLAAVALAAALIDQPQIDLIACSALAIVMIGAVSTHLRRAEYKPLAFAAAVGIPVIAGIVLRLASFGK